MQELDGTGKTTTFTLDAQGNVTQEQTTGRPGVSRTDVGQRLTLDNLGLSEDRRTQNRYVLACANPVNFVEVDGTGRSAPIGRRVTA